MTKSKSLLVFLAAVLILLSLCLASCSNSGDDPEQKPTPDPDSLIELEAPTVTLVGDRAMWAPNFKADKFEISLDGALSYLENTMTERKLIDGQSFKIRAIGDGVTFRTGKWSNTVTYNAPEIEEPKPDTYTVIWTANGKTLETDTEVLKGSLPTYDGATPVKESTAKFEYEFVGWSPEITPVSGNTTYTAIFTPTVRSYTVSFYSEDGATLLDSVSVSYGGEAVYYKPAPTKPSTPGVIYYFNGWVTEQGGSEPARLTDISRDISVYASFGESTRLVTVYFTVDNIDYGSTDIIELEAPYGAPITVDGSRIIINGKTVTATPEASSAQYTYSFDGWTADGTVGTDTLIIASFSRTVNTYKVVWMCGEKVLLTENDLPYGTVPVYKGELPVSDDPTLEFAGWTPSVTKVTSDATYYARFESSSEKLIVKYYSEDGESLLDVRLVSYGGAAEFSGAIPEKQMTSTIVYYFNGWVTEQGGSTPADLSSVTDSLSVYASFAAQERLYTVSFCDYDGEIIGFSLVPYGAAAEMPKAPVRNGYRFLGFDGNADNVTEDITLRALYVKQHEVVFIDPLGEIISSLKVDDGKAAEYPTVTPPVGYTHIGWDREVSVILEDAVVRAIYEIKSYTVRFELPDGSYVGEQSVDHGFSAEAPELDGHFAFHDADSTRVFAFTGFDKPLTNITEDTVIRAVYDTAPSVPVLLLCLSERTDTVEMYIYTAGLPLSALLVEIGYVKGISVSGVAFNSASPLWMQDGEGNNNNQYVVNNNIGSFRFAWSSAEGEQFTHCSRFATLSVERDGADLDPETFRTVSVSAVIDTEGEPIKVIPVVIYR